MKQLVAILAPVAILFAGAAAVPAFSQSAGDADEGADVFDSYCGDCHSVSPRGINKKGPTLYRIVGRRAGTEPAFRYSAQMAGSGIVWSPDRLAAYLANPRAVVPQGIMKFKGLPRPADRANVIAYLRNPD